MASDVQPVKHVHYHDCPALGPHTKVIRALTLDRAREVVLYFQHKCPFCSYVAGDREYGSGVTPRPDGSFSVDMSKAERVSKGER